MAVRIISWIVMLNSLFEGIQAQNMSSKNDWVSTRVDTFKDGPTYTHTFTDEVKKNQDLCHRYCSFRRGHTCSYGWKTATPGVSTVGNGHTTSIADPSSEASNTNAHGTATTEFWSIDYFLSETSTITLTYPTSYFQSVPVYLSGALHLSTNGTAGCITFTEATADPRHTPGVVTLPVTAAPDPNDRFGYSQVAFSTCKEIDADLIDPYYDQLIDVCKWLDKPYMSAEEAMAPAAAVKMVSSSRLDLSPQPTKDAPLVSIESKPSLMHLPTMTSSTLAPKPKRPIKHPKTSRSSSTAVLASHASSAPSDGDNPAPTPTHPIPKPEPKNTKQSITTRPAPEQPPTQSTADKPSPPPSHDSPIDGADGASDSKEEPPSTDQTDAGALRILTATNNSPVAPIRPSHAAGGVDTNGNDEQASEASRTHPTKAGDAAQADASPPTQPSNAGEPAQAGASSPTHPNNAGGSAQAGAASPSRPSNAGDAAQSDHDNQSAEPGPAPILVTTNDGDSNKPAGESPPTQPSNAGNAANAHHDDQSIEAGTPPKSVTGTDGSNQQAGGSSPTRPSNAGDATPAAHDAGTPPTSVTGTGGSNQQAGEPSPTLPSNAGDAAPAAHNDQFTKAATPHNSDTAPSPGSTAVNEPEKSAENDATDSSDQSQTASRPTSKEGAPKSGTPDATPTTQDTTPGSSTSVQGTTQASLGGFIHSGLAPIPTESATSAVASIPTKSATRTGSLSPDSTPTQYLPESEAGRHGVIDARLAAVAAGAVFLSCTFMNL